MGSGATAAVAKKYERNYVGIELNQEYVNMSVERVSG
jgi:DNA modification methylase